MTPSLRLACVGGLGLLGGFGGCLFDEEREHEPPLVTEIRLVEADTIRLTFSEMISAPAGLEIGVFRLSAAIARDGATVYYAMEATDDDLGGDDGTGSTSATEGSGDGSSTTAGLAPDDDRSAGLVAPPPVQAVFDAVIREVKTPIDLYARPIHDALEIELFEPISDMPGCDRVRGIPLADGAVFLHYRPAGDAAITDFADNPLAPIAGHWVQHEELATVDVAGTFPNLHPRVPLPCP